MSRVPDLKPVVVTRAETSDGPLTRELKSLGLPTLLWPAVSVTPADPGPLTAALAALRSFGWIVFASRNAVAAVLERLPAAPPACGSRRSARRARKCCVSGAGPWTSCPTRRMRPR